MGRKLNSIEAASLAFSDASSAQSPTLSSRSQLLQQQVAQQLGISPDEFLKGRIGAETEQTEDAVAAAFDIALSRECLELVAAYVRIRDAEQRRRCLQAVREVAYGSGDAGPVTEV